MTASGEPGRNAGRKKKEFVRVPVDMLDHCEGIIASEVIGRNGEVLLPAGLDINMFKKSMATLIKKMKAHKIESVYLNAPQQLSDEELDEIIDKVYADEDRLIEKEKAKDVIKHITSMFSEARDTDGQIGPEMITGLSNMSHTLTDDLLRNPPVTFSLAKVKERDEYTFVHSFNIALLIGHLALRLYPGKKEFLQLVILGGLLHDLGKALIPNNILNKPGPLTSEEFKVMKQHPDLGVKLSHSAGITNETVVGIIASHHEKWSGKGYPLGIKGHEIPEAARIAAVADVFDALTAKRVYKDPMSSKNAITLIIKDAGNHFDIRIVREMLISLGLYPPGSIVSLSDGRVGVVVSAGGSDLIRPIVMIRMKKGETNQETTFINLKKSPLYIKDYLGHGNKRNIDST